MKLVALLCLLLAGCGESETCYSVDDEGGVLFSAACSEEEIHQYFEEHGILQDDDAPAP